MHLHHDQEGLAFIADTNTRSSCYTEFVLKNVTITLEEDALRWARREAADKGTSVSKLVGKIIERERRQTDDYWKAFEHWKTIKPVPMKRKIGSIRREEMHERGR